MVVQLQANDFLLAHKLVSSKILCQNDGGALTDLFSFPDFL